MLNSIRRIIRKSGFDLHRVSESPGKISWLKSLGIKTVVDVGANVGQFRDEIREILPETFIYSFEPLKECFRKLSSIESTDSKFKAFNFALGDKSEKVLMYKSEYTLSSSILQMLKTHKEAFPHTKNSSLEEIAVIRMDEFFSQKDIEKEILIKVDTQGFEDKVIAGGKETFAKAKVLIIETSFIPLYKNQPLFEDIYNMLVSMGFRYKGALHQKLDPQSGEILFEDSFFTRLDKEIV